MHADARRRWLISWETTTREGFPSCPLALHSAGLMQLRSGKRVCPDPTLQQPQAFSADSASTWGFAIYRASHDDYETSLLPSGYPAGTPEEALDCACGLYLADPAAWLPPADTPTDMPTSTPAALSDLGVVVAGSGFVVDVLGELGKTGSFR
jgi:hypothetical protein